MSIPERETLFAKADPLAIISRGLLNHSLWLPQPLKDALEENRNRWEDSRAEYFVRTYEHLLKEATGKSFTAEETLLEIGVGPGEIARHLKERGLKVIGIDIKDSRIKRDGDFDYLSLTSVLHHLPKDLHFIILQQAKRVLKSNGYLLIQEDIRTKQHLFTRAVDWFVSGPEADSHKTVTQWEQFFLCQIDSNH